MFVDNYSTAYDQLFVIIAATVFTVWGVLLSYFDLTQRRLPDSLTLPAIPIMLMWALMTGHFGAALLGATLWWLLYVGAALVTPHSYGGGDIKLAATVGGIAAVAGGALGWFVAVIAAGVCTGMAGIVLAARARTRSGPLSSISSSRRIPHGPGMLIGTCAALLLGVTWV